jgi:hypothetical protein
MTKGDKVIVPENVPQKGEIFKHYKGDLYKVLFLAEHNDPDELCVIYEAFYPNPDFPYFSRLLRSWNEDVEWNGEKVKRFTKSEV